MSFDLWISQVCRDLADHRNNMNAPPHGIIIGINVRRVVRHQYQRECGLELETLVIQLANCDCVPTSDHFDSLSYETRRDLSTQRSPIILYSLGMAASRR